jgi:hypothetical protein
LAHDLDDLAQDAVYLRRQGNLFTIRTEEQARLGVAFDETCQVEELVEVFWREDDVFVPVVFDGGGPGSAGALAGRGHGSDITTNRKNRKL